MRLAGEASGDRLAARVVAAMRSQAPGILVRGYGGPALAAAGARLDREIVEHAVVGFTAEAASLPYWWTLCAQSLAISSAWRAARYDATQRPPAMASAPDGWIALKQDAFWR